MIRQQQSFKVIPPFDSNTQKSISPWLDYLFCKFAITSQVNHLEVILKVKLKKHSRNLPICAVLINEFSKHAEILST